MKKNLSLFYILLLILGNLTFVYGHGADIEYSQNMSYKITARFESGEPMANAQIIIYAPDNPKEPWETGSSNEDGEYIFTPDTSKKGQWMIQARLASHGTSININIDENASVPSSSSYNKGQILLMLVSLIWGCIGTALYFKNSKKKENIT